MPVLSNGIVVSQNFYNFLEDTSKNYVSFLIRISGSDCIKKDINYLDCHYEDGEVRISYLDTRKFLGLFSRKIEEEEAFSESYHKRRIYVNPGRIVKKLLDESMIRILPLSTIEEFVNLTYSYFGTQLQYKVVKGEDIRKYYLSENYIENIGTLGVSCMKYEACQPYLDIYVDNAKMLIGLVPGTDKISLRALLWDDVNVDLTSELKKIKMMDRIYSTYEKCVPQAKKWAKENGYFYKNKQSNDCIKEVVDLDGNVLDLDLSVDMDINKYKHFPYMDTFLYGYKNNLSNYKVRKSRILLRATNGSFE
jgi:hypothetical protein